jgi:hypothetical protein
LHADPIAAAYISFATVVAHRYVTVWSSLTALKNGPTGGRTPADPSEHRFEGAV